MYELKDIQEYLKDKSIVLLGNANSIFNNKKDIDSFEIVCRCNWSYPDLYEPTFNIDDYKDYIGTRTDVLFTSGKAMATEKLLTIIKPKVIVRTRGSMTNMTTYMLKNSMYWGERIWSPWCIEIDFSPTTGCLALHFLMEEIKFKSLTLYGFDFFATYDHTEPSRTIITHGHNPEKEKQYITETVEKYSNIKLIKE